MTEPGDLLRSDDVRLLVELGFMTLSQGFVAQSDTLFAGVVAARPAQEAGHIGSALALLHRGDSHAALRILRALPPSDPVRLFLGLATFRVGDVREARSILSEIVQSAPDTPHAATARTWLEAFPA